MKETVFTNYISAIYGAGSSMPIFDKQTTLHDDDPIIDAFSDKSVHGSDSEHESESEEEEETKEELVEEKVIEDDQYDHIDAVPEHELPEIETYGEPLPETKKQTNFFDRIKALSITTTYKDKKEPIVDSVLLIEEYSEPKKETKKEAKGSGKIKFNGGMNDTDIASLLKSYK